MRVKIAKWGNSAAIRLPKAVMDAMKIDEGMELELHVEGQEIRAVAVPQSSPLKLNDLVAEMTRLGGSAYDYGQEEWPLFPSELNDYKGFHDGN